MEDEQERCDGCNGVIMYESPENFDPVCMDEGGLVHAECCCACEVDDTGEVTFKTESYSLGNLDTHNPDTWLRTVWNALDCHRENSIPCARHEDGSEDHEEGYDREWEEIRTAMAWIGDCIDYLQRSKYRGFSK
tara:strand:- start:2004 stop:2405 length:402 start_codon:yes stop_codon:yes gene_type:complete